jgi:hypothetical protein
MARRSIVWPGAPTRWCCWTTERAARRSRRCCCWTTTPSAPGWHRLYEDDGIEGLASFGYKGSACRLNDEHQDRLKAWIAETVPRTTREIGTWIEQECGHRVSGAIGVALHEILRIAICRTTDCTKVVNSCLGRLTIAANVRRDWVPDESDCVPSTTSREYDGSE